MIRRVLIGLIVLAGVYALLNLPITWFYRDRRPTRLGRGGNRLMSWLAALGTPIIVTLEVAGRRTGRPAATVLVPVEFGGAEYFVSMLGEGADWVRNIRAGGGEAVIRHGGRRAVRLDDVPVEERAPILKAYLARAGGARPHFPIDEHAPVEEFERLAHEYPVFRVTEEHGTGNEEPGTGNREQG